MHWYILPDWNSLESVRRVHAFLEGFALIFFAGLVVFDVVAHILGRRKNSREKVFEVLALVCFAIAVLAEIVAYPYSRRNDSLSGEQDKRQREKIAALQLETQSLANSTEQLRAETATARAEAEGFKSQIADSNARAKHAEAQVASANAASKEAVAKSELFRFDIAKANESSAKAEARAEEAIRAQQELRKQNLTTETKLVEANRALEAEKSTRLELQQSIAPRGAGWGEISGNSFPTLKEFAGTQVVFEVLTDAEARRAAQEIGNLLMFANWKTVGTTSNPELFAGFFDGVIIVPDQAGFGVFNIPPEQGAEEKRLLDAAEALQEFLDSRGWRSRVQKFSGALGAASPFGEIPKNTIKIIVGFKPNPFFEPDWVKQMEEQLRRAKKRMREIEQKHPPGKP